MTTGKTPMTTEESQRWATGVVERTGVKSVRATAFADVEHIVLVLESEDEGQLRHAVSGFCWVEGVTLAQPETESPLCPGTFTATLWL